MNQRVWRGKRWLMVVTAGALGLTCFQTAYAQGGVAGAFLRMGVGARARAMGDAYTAMARGIEASYYNPAGLPFLEKRELVTSFRLLSLDRAFTFVGVGLPIQPEAKEGETPLDGGLALAWIRAGVDNIDSRDGDGRSLGELSNSENAFVLAFALKPAARLAVGLAVKLLWNRFPNIGNNGETLSSTGVGFDFGLRVEPFSGVILGAAVKDINSKYTWNTQVLFDEDGSEVVNEFPKIVRVGVAARVPRAPWATVALDYEDSEELDGRVHFGLEGAFPEGMVLRAGLDDGSVTAGLGYQFEVLGENSQLNYAFGSGGNRPETEHVFSWVFQF